MFIKVAQIDDRAVFYFKGRFQNSWKGCPIFGLLLVRKIVTKNFEILPNLVTLKLTYCSRSTNWAPLIKLSFNNKWSKRVTLNDFSVCRYEWLNARAQKTTFYIKVKLFTSDTADPLCNKIRDGSSPSITPDLEGGNFSRIENVLTK